MIKKQSHKKNGYSSVILVIFFLFLILTFRSFTSKPFKVPKEVQAVTGTLNFNAASGTQTLGSPNMANLYVTGSVGIGTAQPGSKLDVQGGDINVSGKIKEAGNSLIPAGAVMFYNLAACPTGWTELTAARGRTVVGLPLSGTLAGTNTGTTSLTDLGTRTITAVAAHTHSVDPPATASGGQSADHTHGVSIQSGTVSSWHTHTFTSGGVSANHTHGVSIQSGTVSSWHTHTVTTGGRSAAHTHTIGHTTGAFSWGWTVYGGTVGWAAAGTSTSSTESVDHTHTGTTSNPSLNHSHAVSGNTGYVSVGHTHDGTTSNPSLNHSHAVSGNTGYVSVGHTHTTDIGAFNSASAGSASVDVSMPYIQLLICSKD